MAATISPSRLCSRSGCTTELTLYEWESAETAQTEPLCAYHVRNRAKPVAAAMNGGSNVVQIRAEVEPITLEAVSVHNFVAIDEPGAEALVGKPDAVLIPVGGDVMVYGDGGAGKTTLCVDLAFHAAAGDDWLSMPMARPARVLLVENEGPRALFRAKLRRKRDGWTGSPLEDRLLVVEAPWAKLSFDDPACREALATLIRDHDIDVVIVGPVTRSGMNEAGTLQEVRDFMVLIAAVRELAGRHVTFVLVHHENKGGQVSGAWEGAGDTLLHVQGQGNGRTRLFVQKARWSSSHHGTALNLVWADGDGFEVEDKPVIDDDTVAGMILTAVRDDPGAAWRAVEDATPGVGTARRRGIRDRMLEGGQLLNVVDGVPLDHCPARKPARLYAHDDPTIAHTLTQTETG
jgi:hypothetical protein